MQTSVSQFCLVSCLRRKLLGVSGINLLRVRCPFCAPTYSIKVPLITQSSPERQNQSEFKWGKRWWGFEMRWHQLDHMQAICTLLQMDNHHNLITQFLQTGRSFWLTTNGVKALTASNNQSSPFLHLPQVSWRGIAPFMPALNAIIMLNKHHNTKNLILDKNTKLSMSNHVQQH